MNSIMRIRHFYTRNERFKNISTVGCGKVKKKREFNPCQVGAWRRGTLIPLYSLSLSRSSPIEFYFDTRPDTFAPDCTRSHQPFAQEVDKYGMLCC